MKAINIIYIHVNTDGYDTSINYLPESAEILNISVTDMAPSTLEVLYQHDMNDNTLLGSKYFKVQVRLGRIHNDSIELPYWGVSVVNKSLLRMSGNSIEIDNITERFYIFAEVEKTVSEIRDEKIKKLIEN